MRRIVLLGLAWTAVVFAGLTFIPWGLEPVPCARLVGASAECLAQLAARNDRVWWTQTLPMLAAIAGGYLVIILLALRHIRHARRTRG
jgi:prepilin signal peptidase PulO-like enzyme (type II secretory pathway)